MDVTFIDMSKKDATSIINERPLVFNVKQSAISIASSTIDILSLVIAIPLYLGSYIYCKVFNIANTGKCIEYAEANMETNFLSHTAKISDNLNNIYKNRSNIRSKPINSLAFHNTSNRQTRHKTQKYR
jgi:hypothetical protein